MGKLALYILQLVPSLIAVALSLVAPRLVTASTSSGATGDALLKEVEGLVQRFLALAFVTVLAVWGVVFSGIFSALSAPVSECERVRLWLALEAPAGLFFVFAILNVAISRSKDSTAVFGQRQQIGSTVELAIRKLANTTEQLLLAFVARGALAATLPLHLLPSALALTIGLWIAARILFYTGYTLQNPAGREFGFDLTIANSLVALLIAIWYAV